MKDTLPERYDLGVGDLNGPEAGFFFRKMVGKSRQLGQTGAPPWVLLPASVIAFRRKTGSAVGIGGPAFGDLTPQERSALRMIELIVEHGRKSDHVFIVQDQKLWEARGNTGEARDLPFFESAIMFDAAVRSVKLFRGFDGSVVSIAIGKARTNCPIALGAQILQFHHEIWPDVPLLG
jgi:hypothetical protein